MYALRFFIFLMASFGLASTGSAENNNNPVNNNNNNNNNNKPANSKVVPKTYFEVKKLIDDNPGKTNRDAWEIVQCITVFESNGLPIDEMYNGFHSANPNRSVLDFYEHLISEVAPAITANTIKYSKEVEPFYYALRIKSKNKQDIERVKSFQDPSQIMQFCNSYGVFVEGKLMNKNAILGVYKKPEINTFSKVQNNNVCGENLYTVYYITTQQDLPSNFTERNNLARKALSEITGFALL